MDVDDDGEFSQHVPLCAVHHNKHERSPILRSLRQIEHHHATQNPDLLGHDPGH